MTGYSHIVIPALRAMMQGHLEKMKTDKPIHPEAIEAARRAAWVTKKEQDNDQR